MGKTSFHQFTALLLQSLAAVALHPSPVASSRLPPRLGFVLPVVLLTLWLRDVGPGVETFALGQGLGLVVALVGHRLLDLLLATGPHQVGLGLEHTRRQGGRVSLVSGVHGRRQYE